MKNILLLAATFAVLALPVRAQLIIDQIVWTSPAGPGAPARAGVISPTSGATDYLDGDAVCNPNYPFPPVGYFTIVYGGIEVANTVPECGSNEYWIIGWASSTRQDGNYTNLNWEGASWYPNVPGYPPNLPNTQQWAAACYQTGTDKYGRSNGLLGAQYIVAYNPGLCYAL